jgi:addiction module RelE/StbE family toxin
MIFYQVVWSRNALNDLIEITDFIEPYHPEAADKIELLIKRTADTLNLFPERCYYGRVPNTRQINVPGLDYIISYRILKDSNTVQILSVFHGKRKIP